jgi:hypothetical protein
MRALENRGLRVGRPARPPLRTLKEMAEEFGVRHATLSGLLSTCNGPKSRMDTRGCQTNQAHWYEPNEMRK